MATNTDVEAPTAPPPPPPEEAAWDEKRASRKDTREGWLFCTPYLVLFAVFVVFPAGWGLWISLHRYDFTLPNKPFIGLDNYISLINGSSPWRASSGNPFVTRCSSPSCRRRCCSWSRWG